MTRPVLLAALMLLPACETIDQAGHYIAGRAMACDAVRWTTPELAVEYDRGPDARDAARQRGGRLRRARPILTGGSAVRVTVPRVETMIQNGEREWRMKTVTATG